MYCIYDIALCSLSLKNITLCCSIEDLQLRRPMLWIHQSYNSWARNCPFMKCFACLSEWKWTKHSVFLSGTFWKSFTALLFLVSSFEKFLPSPPQEQVIRWLNKEICNKKHFGISLPYLWGHVCLAELFFCYSSKLDTLWSTWNKNHIWQCINTLNLRNLVTFQHCSKDIFTFPLKKDHSSSAPYWI